MARRSFLASLLAAFLLLGVLVGPAAAETPPYPASMAAVGDSITQAASTGGSLGADYPENSWATGTNATVNSHYQRLLALNPAISGAAYNLSVSGAKMADLQGQMQQAVALQPDYLTVLIGGNDICTDTEAQMTSVADFRAQFQAAMATISAGSGDTNVYVVSIPRVLGLWELFRNNWWARFIWSVGDICQSLLANPTSTQTADVERRARVAQRNIDFNQVLFEVCSAAPRCLWDGWAAYGTEFTTSDVSGDYFHPSIAGQAKLASVSWAIGYWSAPPPPPPPPNQPPTAAFAFSCTDLSCTFDGSASTDADGTIVSYAWDFDGDGTASGPASAHTFSTAGTWDVTLSVTDDDGAPASVTHPVTVTAPAPAGTVSLASLTAGSSARRGGWTATVSLTAVDGNGQPVSGASVSGEWSTGAGGGCTTQGSAGSCSFQLNVGKKVTSVTWTISTISHATLTYEATALTSATATRP
ncbi:MAG TPA: PKD domain-containing protein [Candidatus Limnocylindria bacterium]